MRDAARESNAITGIGFNYRYVPALQLTKQLIDEGLFGEIYRVRGRCLQDWLGDPEEPWNWRTDENRAGTGVLGDVGSHTIDLARWLIGDVERISGQLTIHIPERPVADGDGTRGVTTDDEYSAIAEFDSGRSVSSRARAWLLAGRRTTRSRCTARRGGFESLSVG